MQPATSIFLQSVNTICPNLTHDELSQFATHLTLKDLKRKDLFLQSGKIQKNVQKLGMAVYPKCVH